MVFKLIIEKINNLREKSAKTVYTLIMLIIRYMYFFVRWANVFEKRDLMIKHPRLTPDIMHVLQDGKGRGRKRDSSDDEDFSEYQDLMKKNKFKKYYSDSDRVGILLYCIEISG